MSANTKTESSDPQAPKERSVNDLLDNVTLFIDSVYRDLNILSPPPSCANAANRSRYSLTSCSPQRSLSTTLPSDTSLNSSASPEGASAQSPKANKSSADESFASATMSTRTQRNIDADIERINRICDTVDQNLRSIGLFVNTGRGSGNTNPSNNDINEIDLSTPPSITASCSTAGGSPRRVRLADPVPRTRFRRSAGHTPLPRFRFIPPFHVPNEVVADDDDEVVLVSSNLPPVIDLCTPSHEEPRRPVLNRNELTRRNLEHHERRPSDVVVPVRRRRISMSSNDLETSLESEPESRKSTDGDGETSDRTPFMCPVCMESCLKRKPTSTKCGHVFCERCIKQAIRLTHKCPMCKSKISCSQLFRIYV